MPDIQDLLDPLFFIVSPEKRIFWGFILANIVLVYLVVVFKKEDHSKVWRQCFSKNYWLNSSCGVDLLWILCNHLVRLFILLPLLGAQIGLALALNRTLTRTFGSGDFLTWPSELVAVIFTLSVFIIDDFMRFFLHFSYHKIPLLWRFHAIHHSATTLTPLTLYRVHSVELCLNYMRSFFVIGAISAVFMYVFKGAINTIDVIGVSIFSFIFNMAGANLRHSPIWIGFGSAERWFISPAQHQIHHSLDRAHYDKNFGSAMAIWDRLFKTWVPSKNNKVDRFGLETLQNSARFSKQLLGIDTQTRPKCSVKAEQ